MSKLDSAALVVDHVTKEFVARRGRHTVFSNLCMTVADGEFVAMIGPTGCGKTTLLNLLAGLDLPSEGVIAFHDRRVLGPDPKRGVVFQQYALFPWLTVAGNVEFGLRIAGVQKNERRSIVDHYLEMMHLTAFRDLLPKELSGGMKQRASLARAYANNPEVLLMDEPFGSLDAQTRRVLQLELLALWQRERRTVVFVTHDIEEALLLSQRVAVLGGSPTTITREVTVPFPYPRSEETTSLPEFAELRASLWNELLPSASPTMHSPVAQ